LLKNFLGYVFGIAVSITEIVWPNDTLELSIKILLKDLCILIPYKLLELIGSSLLCLSMDSIACCNEEYINPGDSGVIIFLDTTNSVALVLGLKYW